MHKSSKCLEKYAGVILFRPEYAGVSSGVEKIAPDFCRSKKIYSGRSSVWSPLVTPYSPSKNLPKKNKKVGVTMQKNMSIHDSLRIGIRYIFK